eukprot:scaffold79976_cov72-Phaeocystis_antarctica.AAC.2
MGGVLRDCAAGICCWYVYWIERMWNHETRPHMCCDVMEQSGMCLVSIVVRVVRARKVIEPATLHTLTPSHTHPRHY